MAHKKRIKSPMQHQFARNASANIPRSSFNRSHGHKTTFDSGILVPILCDLALPGDTFSVNLSAIARLSTPIAPIMDNMYLDTFFFAVPIRLIWDNWQKFNGEQDNPGDSTDFTCPTVTAPAGGFPERCLSDYFGLPTQVDNITVNSFWHRAYNLIYNEWFRSQDLQNSAIVDKDDGPDNCADYPLRRRGKRHDYFTSCLPWPQKGEAVTLPLGGSAPLSATEAPVLPSGGNPLFTNGTFTSGLFAQTGGTNVTLNQTSANSNSLSWVSPNLKSDLTGITADLSTATAATVADLREAFQIQKLLERDARSGTRYTEIIQSHFGVTSPDARLQRPEYLGGGITPVMISPIAQTSSTDATTPQGNLSAIGTANVQGHGFTKSFTEHCVILGLACVRADLTYQQGINRMFNYQTRYDWYWPVFSHLGEQAVLNKEIYAQGTAEDENVFGYNERYAELRYKPSIITSDFRSNAAGSLDLWHLAQDFTSLPVLGDTFISENPPVDRVVAVPSEPQFIFDSHFSMRCVRPMPLFGTPGLIDHF